MPNIELDPHAMKSHIASPADESGLQPLVRVMLEGLRPLRPLAAQLLWLGQPVLALFERGDLVDEWVVLLDGPSGREKDGEDPA